MKRILSLFISVLLCLSMFSCDLKKITEFIEEGIDTENRDENGILIEWECDDLRFDSEHDALERDDYYRYSMLSAEEKSVYTDIYDAVMDGVSILNIEKYKLTSEKLEELYRIFIADNPALFYISRNCQYVYEDGIVTDLLIRYTDGENTDKFNSDGTLSAVADRTIIKKKLEELKNQVDEILSDIPSDISDFDKEMMIHDYLVRNIEYNYEEAESITEGDVLSHAFDVYGAVCKGDAVCEGYAKSFQLLCYEVGINCAQVEGIGDSGEHMWNAVYIDDWYYVDVTWDDGINDSKFPYYAYFNIPEDDLEKDHTIDNSTLEAPSCNSDEYAYYNQYCSIVNDLDVAPENYKRSADLIDEGVVNYVVIYADGVQLDSDYIVKYFIAEDSVFNSYVRRKSYNITPDNEYFIIGNYYYIAV